MIKENPPYEISWPVGLGCWVAWKNEWRHGLIEERPSPTLALIRLDSGELVKTGFRGMVYRDEPRGKSVPKSRTTNGSTGIRAKLFETDPVTGRLIKRKEGVWSNKADACLGCGRTDRPHMARGLCHPCYANWRYRTNFNGTADNSKRRAKVYRIRTDYDAIQHERNKNNPRHREIHRKASLKYAQRFAKWPLGSKVESPIDNFVFGENRVTVSKRMGSSRTTFKGTILSKSNCRAAVQFATWSIDIPFARLTLLAEERMAG